MNRNKIIQLIETLERDKDMLFELRAAGLKAKAHLDVSNASSPSDEALIELFDSRIEDHDAAIMWLKDEAEDAVFPRSHRVHRWLRGKGYYNRWISNLMAEKGHRPKAERNHFQNNCDTDIIRDAFSWSGSPEGHLFWNKVNEEMLEALVKADS